MASDIEVQADLSDSGNDEYNETDKSKNKSKSGQSLLEPLKDITGKFCRHSFVNKRARSSTELSTSNKSCNGITWETNSDTYQYTIELQTKMLYKINNIELQNETIMARLTAMERDSHVKIPQSQLHFSEELSKLFPIKKFENLTDLEIRLNNKSFFSQVIQYFISKGGYSSHNLIWNIMNTCITNTVAVEFSYKGQKGKKKFYCTKLNTCIHKAAQFSYPSVTDAEIIYFFHFEMVGQF
ncbi:uncharacterized protein [Temnothorax nylanderi]|uniref:uncharacterized protein isoform X1 n=1 Tax=Temnothorax nylanderi TaxID=102681 RepID=UPI003A8A1E08